MRIHPAHPTFKGHLHDGPPPFWKSLRAENRTPPTPAPPESLPFWQRVEALNEAHRIAREQARLDVPRLGRVVDRFA